jgi:hypothetical protein
VNFDGFNDPNLTLQGALSALMDTYDISLDVDARGFRYEGIRDELGQRIAPTPIPAMRHVPLSEVIQAVIARLPVSGGATFIINGEEIEITTRRQLLSDGWDKVRSLPEDYIWRVRYSGATSIDRYGTEAIRSIAELLYWNRVLNDNAKAIIAARQTSPAKGGKARQ